MNRISKTLRSLTLCALACLFAGFGYADDEKKWDEQPSVMKSIAPDNPNKLTGMVTALVVIDADGGVESASISKSTDAALEEPVLAALKQWRFNPAKLEGKPIKCTIKVPFKFQG